MTKKAFIDNKPFEFEDDITILEAARAVGAYVPTLCEFKPLCSTPGTCSVCLVEVERKNGQRMVITSCKTGLEDGMKVYTTTPRVRSLQRQQVELIFADHDQDCVACPRWGNCELLQLGKRLSVKKALYTNKFTAQRTIDNSDASLKLDANKCVRCYRCVEVCKKVQGCGALSISGVGTNCGVSLVGTDLWKDSSLCVRCGQCTLVCPTGALAERDQTDEALSILENPDFVTIVQFAPSVRATLGEAFGLPAGTNVEGKIVTALKLLGADYVFDTNFSADVTIMEEGTELLNRVKKGKEAGPMFTSCCPAWVNWVEQIKPELIPHVSTCRSPQGMMSSLAKSWLPDKLNINPGKVKVISIMPCTAKKSEARRPQLADGSLRDTDIVLTVREFARLLMGRGIELANLEDSEPDTPYLSKGTGAGMIFGRSAGVAEAAARTLYFLTNGVELPDEVPWQPSEHPNVDREVELELQDIGKIRVAAVYGLANAAVIADEVLAGKSSYDFIEVMACPGGCVNGGGTIRDVGKYFAKSQSRTAVLDKADKKLSIRQSHNNPMVTQIYQDFLGTPNSHRAHQLLHTEFSNRKPEQKQVDVRDLWKKIELV